MSSPSWRDRLKGIAGELRNDLHQAAERAGIGGPPQPYDIAAYRGYGNGKRMLVHGRVLERKDISRSTATDSAWRNMVNIYKRIESDPVPFAHVRVRVGTVEHEVMADNEGF